MEVMIEVIYGLHVLMLLISYECMTILLQINPRFKTMLKDCFVLSSTFIFLFIDQNGLIVFIVWFVLFVCLYHKRVFLYFPTFMVVYCTCIFFISSLSYSSFIYNGILIVQLGFSLIASFVVMVLCSMTTILYIVYCKKKISSDDYMYDVALYHKNRITHIKALLDSGNELYYHGYPLILLSRKCVDEYEVIDYMISQGVVEKRIDIIVIEKMMINGQLLCDIYVGVVDDLGYDGLLNKKLMGGVL